MIMGCFNSKEKPVVTENKYSWLNKEKVDPSQYTISNVKYGSLIKQPGDISGEQFIVESCELTNIGLFDLINTITIDDCTNCSIFVGPTIGSVVLRNCFNCRVMCCSQQFRARDCKNCDIFLYCATQPAIESCYDLNFGCFSAYYNGLEDQFKRANLSVFNNNWTNVYDFTVSDGERHWNLFPNPVKAEDFFSGIPSYESLGLLFDSSTSVVPKTLGLIRSENDVREELVLMLIISGEQTHSTAGAVIKQMQCDSEIFLLKTKEFYAITTESQILFGVDSNQLMVALLYKGPECVKKSHDISRRSSGILIVSNPVTIFKQLSIIFNASN